MEVELRDGEGKVVGLPVGETILGRGDFLGNQDKKLSRKQVLIIITLLYYIIYLFLSPIFIVIFILI